MIAFAIIVLCIFPLLYPHAAITRSQKDFLKKIELDHFVTLQFGHIYEKLLVNEVRFEDIQNQKHFEIEAKKPGFKGYYYFSQEPGKVKSNEQNDTFAYIYNLNFVFEKVFSKKDKPMTYTYKVFIMKGNQE